MEGVKSDVFTQYCSQGIVVLNDQLSGEINMI